MRFIEFIAERVSAMVYHYSPMNAALKILESGNFLLTSSTGTDEEQHEYKNKKFFMSVTRSLTGGYHQSMGSGVMFNLDGNKLNQRYAGKSVDYFGDREEMEDRVFSDSNTIPIKGNVTSVHVLYSPRATTMQQLRQIQKVCEARNLPCYFYDSREGWLRQSKVKRVEFDSINLSNTGKNASDTSDENRYTGMLEVLSEILTLPREKQNDEHRQLLSKLTGPSKANWWDKIEAGMIEASKPGINGYDATVKIVRFMRTKKLAKLPNLVNYVDKEIKEKQK